MKTPAVLFVTLSGVALCASAADDIVNERAQASDRERERHWSVDCVRLGAEVLEWLERQPEDCAGSAPDPRLSEELRLCGAIHNIPGEPRSCPDYATAARLLDELMDPRACAGANQQQPIRSSLSCPH